MEMKELRIDQIRPNPLQPREVFDKEKIRELAESIKETGLLQPIVVRQQNDNYQIICGDRRWRAFQFAGLNKIPAIVKDVSDDQVLFESLVENVHREDLTDVEKVRAMNMIMEANDIKTHTELSKRINIPQSTIRHLFDNVCLRGELLGPTKNASSSVISETFGLPEEIRKTIVEKAVEADIGGRKVRKFVSTYKKASEPVKKAMLEKDSLVTPDTAEQILSISVEGDQEKIIKLVEKERLAPEKIGELVATVKKAPEPVKRAVLDTDMDMDTAEEITVAFEDLPDDATEQVTEEVLEMVSKGRSDAYITKHIETRQWEAERMADPAFKEPVGYDLNAYERFANGIIKRCQVVEDIFVGRIVDMPKIHQEKSITAILTAHKYLERNIQFLHQKGLLTTDAIDTHRADCAVQLTEGITVPEVGAVEAEFVVDADYEGA